jgi:hypothetical protein
MRKALLVFLLMSVLSNNIFSEQFISADYRKDFFTQKEIKLYPKLISNAIAYIENEQKRSINGLIGSYKDTSLFEYDANEKEFYESSYSPLTNQAFTYDNAMVILTYLICNKTKKAKQILKIYEKEFYVLKNDNNLENAPGIYNSYRTDETETDVGLRKGIDGDRMHVGPNVWICIAALQYTALTGDLSFLKFVIDVCKWIETLPHFEFKDGSYGAVSMGSGWGTDFSKVFSTENAADHYGCLKLLKDIYNTKNKNIKRIFKKNKYTLKNIETEQNKIVKWLTTIVYDKNKHAFNVGYNQYGIDKVDALDTVSWMIQSLTPEKLESLGINPFKLMDFADENYLVKCKIKNRSFEGYDFTNLKSRKKNYKFIWFEGTFFHIVTMQIMAQYATKKGLTSKAKYYNDKAKKLLSEMVEAANIIKLPNKVFPYISERLGDKDYKTNFQNEWEMPRANGNKWVSSLSSTTWYIIALSAFNPLNFDKENTHYKLFLQDI